HAVFGDSRNRRKRAETSLAEKLMAEKSWAEKSMAEKWDGSRCLAFWEWQVVRRTMEWGQVERSWLTAGLSRTNG
ncbi:MAG TPA: hypothetical protein PLW35_10420, partial [Verrucomicrobiota bacterium]|nr:hypothetical protein [Verrucomicrobiota bacterium]